MCKLIYGLAAEFMVASCPSATPEQVTRIRDRLLENHAELLLHTTLYCLKKLGYNFLSEPAGVVEFWLKHFFDGVLERVVNGYDPHEGAFLAYLITCYKNTLISPDEEFPERTAKLKVPWPTRRTRGGERIELEVADCRPSPLRIVLLIEEQKELNERREQEEKEQAERQQQEERERQRLRDAFCRHYARLREPDRTAFFLHKIREPALTYEETRRELCKRLGYDVPRGSARGWINRAQHELARLIHEDAPGGEYGPPGKRSNGCDRGTRGTDSPADPPQPVPLPHDGEGQRENPPPPGREKGGLGVRLGS